MKKLLLVATLICLSSCKMLEQKRVTPEHFMLKNKVGVIALLPGQPSIDYIGPSVMESKRNKAVLPHWDPNRMALEVLGKRLKTKGLEVTVLQGPDDLMRVYDSSAGFARPERVREQLAAFGAARELDMIVVVYRQTVKDFISESSENVYGYGLFKSHRTEPHAFAAVLVEAIDVRAGSVIGHSDGYQAVPLETRIWRDAYNDTQGPFPIGADDDGYVRRNIASALRGAIMLAAQEAGLSN